MGAKVKNPRKKFLWSISFPKHPINTYLFQTCQLPDIEMLNQAYYSFAVANAREEVRKAARFQADSNVRGGVLKILKGLL